MLRHAFTRLARPRAALLALAVVFAARLFFAYEPPPTATAHDRRWGPGVSDSPPPTESSPIGTPPSPIDTPPPSPIDTPPPSPIETPPPSPIDTPPPSPLETPAPTWTSTALPTPPPESTETPAPAPVTETPTPMRTPSATATDGPSPTPSSTRTVTRTPTVTRTRTPTPTPRPSRTPIPTPDIAVRLVASGVYLRAGSLLRVDVIAANFGAGLAGRPQYQLVVNAPDGEMVLLPAAPAPVTHDTTIGAGQTGSATFNFSAACPGLVTLRASVSYDVYLAPPARWTSSSPALLVEVMPRADRSGLACGVDLESWGGD